VISDDDATFTIVLEPPVSQPPPFLPRVLALYPVDDPSDALRYLRRHRLPLEGFALSSMRTRLVDMAIAGGAARLAYFGELQRPPISGHHGGRSRIAEFVQWIDKAP